MGCRVYQSQRTCVLTLSGFQIAAALLFLVVGFISLGVFWEYERFSSDPSTTIPAVCITAGVIFVVLAVLGCFGAIKINRCALTFFLVVAGAIFVAELIGACVTLAVQDTAKDQVVNEFSNWLTRYDNETSVAKDVDWMQENLQCCGANNATDFVNATIPSSCCQVLHDADSHMPFKNCTVNQIMSHNITGCSSELRTAFGYAITAFGAATLGFAVMQLILLGGLVVLVLMNGWVSSNQYSEI